MNPFYCHVAVRKQDFESPPSAPFSTIHLPPLQSESKTSLPRTFTRRTSGLCLAILRSVKLSFSRVLDIASLTTTSTCSLLLLLHVDSRLQITVEVRGSNPGGNEFSPTRPQQHFGSPKVGIGQDSIVVIATRSQRPRRSMDRIPVGARFSSSV